LTLLVASLALSGGCKNADDYIRDLQRVQRKDGTLPIEIYDAGQLAHEAFSGLVTEKALTFPQAGLALALAGQMVERSEVPLLRAQGLALMAHLALRFPVDPIASRLDEIPTDRAAKEEFANRVAALSSAVDRLTIGDDLIPRVGSPDEADVELAYARL
jgi:hypothetical protein